MGDLLRVNFRRNRPSARCTPFALAKARLESLRPCFGTPAHHEAFCVFMGEAVKRVGNVVRLPVGRAGR